MKREALSQSADTAVPVETPEGIRYFLYPAGPLIRACARGIDYICQLVLLFAFSFLFVLVFRGSAGIWVFLLARFVLDWLYQALWEFFGNGQSPGKRLVGIRVVQDNGSPPGAGAALMRNLLSFADTFLGLFIIAFVSISFSRGFRRLGDWAAGTMVVHTGKSRAMERREPLEWLAEFAPAHNAPPLGWEEKQGLLMFAQRYPRLGPARAGEIARPFAEALDIEDQDAAALLGIARNFEGIE
ncbi:MAG: RDD family protein [Treponema sp.]|jgi:uncharacterized RDD family membrane protein YckC|nr:RDD family protein [Treponema sp.]